MQFKVKKHVVETTKSEHAWNRWLVKTRGETAILLIYEYGVAITRAQDLDAFKAARIIPEQTDRAGATAEVSLRDIVASLQEEWESTFRGEAVVWQMWGNHITRNLDRSTWEALVKQPPPEYIANLLRPSDSSLHEHLSNLARSANVALDVVRGSMADYQQLRRDWEAFRRRLEEHERNLKTRRSIMQGFIQDLAPPSPSTVPDPFVELVNADDIDHAE
ncbi:hypothetical protein PHMEG_00017265 [Phytophthora megakarya]|uniref:Uncharacterized protein n=1 Tax=Phytophthora megakarya TaxID=4795 RepID=A0A225VXT9_9STRA|nr:hypothetical protein PHMEG_00017265 [Phytophthora megakarya]